MFGGKRFEPKTDIPDMSGKVILITGGKQARTQACNHKLIHPGNAGLGKETIVNLARHNPQHIWMAARSQSKAEAAIADIQKIVPGASVSHLSLDLASFQSISDAAKKFQSSSSRLDVLINNAGVMALPKGKTVDGYEMHFGTNVMGSFLLTKLLMPTLKSTAQQPGADVRIVNVSSEAHRMLGLGGLVLDESKIMGLGPWTAYANSKLGNILFARECAKRHPEITSVAVHPGIVSETTLWDTYRKSGIFGSVASRVSGMLFSDIQQGAKNQLWAATCKQAELKNGGYYVPVAKAASGSWKASSTAEDAKMWDWIDNECKQKGY